MVELHPSHKWEEVYRMGSDNMDLIPTGNESCEVCGCDFDELEATEPCPGAVAEVAESLKKSEVRALPDPESKTPEEWAAEIERRWAQGAGGDEWAWAPEIIREAIAQERAECMVDFRAFVEDVNETLSYHGLDAYTDTDIHRVLREAKEKRERGEG